MSPLIEGMVWPELMEYWLPEEGSYGVLIRLKFWLYEESELLGTAESRLSDAVSGTVLLW